MKSVWCQLQWKTWMLYRSMRARQDEGLDPASYFHPGELMGHIPIFADCRWFFADQACQRDLLSWQSRRADPQNAAQSADRTPCCPGGIDDHWYSDSFEEVEAVSGCSPARNHNSHAHVHACCSFVRGSLAQLRTCKIENCKKELTTDLFKAWSRHWNVLGEHCSQHGGTGKSRCARPGCAVFCLQAADQRHSRKNKAIDKQLTHQLLTVPNPHRTGKLQGMLLVHENMVVRLADVLAPHLGLVKDKLAVVVKVDLHHEDQKRLDRREPGFCPFFRTTWPKVSGWNYLKERIRPWKMLCCRRGKKSFRMWPITQLTQRHCSLWNWCMQSSKLIWS